MMKTKNEIFVLIMCFLLGFALRFYTFDKKSLWMDEVHTFNDSRVALTEQFELYKESPAYLHPPLFFVLTHFFYPFDPPERNLRIIPLFFGILSIPMLYLLARSFSPPIAIYCALSLTFMAYHISLSQDGRSYSLVMFLGMAGLLFFINYLKTLRKINIIVVAFIFTLLFYTSYSAIPFIAFSQGLWFYRTKTDRPGLLRSHGFSFLLLNGLILILCGPWIAFLTLNYRGQPMMDPFHVENPGSLWSILYGVLHDWVPFYPLMIVSVCLLVLFPLVARSKRNALCLLLVFIVPVAGLYLFCKVFNVTHFFTSRYLVNFLPLFLITLYLSLDAIELRLVRIRHYVRPKLLFLFLFIATNVVILPLYYHAEKQDIRGLVNYLKAHLKQGDKIFVESEGPIPGILHYLGVHPKGRHYRASAVGDLATGIEYRLPFTYRNRRYTIYKSKHCCTQYVSDGSRLWIVVGKETAKKFRMESPCVLKGYFDGSFLNFNRFPTDASLYLFLWDPQSPDERGIDMPIH